MASLALVYDSTSRIFRAKTWSVYGFGEEIHARIEDAVMDNRVTRVARGVEHA
jgi:hypothetical protein